MPNISPMSRLLRSSGPVLSEIVFQVEDAAEGGLTARALDHSIFTEADSYDELREQVLDAVQCHFDDGEHPAIIRLY